MKHIIPAVLALSVALMGLFAIAPLGKADPPAPDIVKAAVALPSAQPPAPVEIAAAPAAPEPIERYDVLGPKHAAMKAYVLDVMNSWPHAVPAEPVASYDDIADDIASAVQNPEDAVLLAGLGYFEGARFASYVDGYGCNDADWRTTDEGKRLMRTWGDCDGGRAYTIFQIHPIVDRASKLYDLCNLDMVGPRGSRYNAARCALAIAGASMKATGDLSGYTGEYQFERPKADQRQRFIERAIAKHPYTGAR